MIRERWTTESGVPFRKVRDPLMAQHPLALLRASAGRSHVAYARLVAETHTRLGYGHMAARREKVSRWESGRTVPELTAQLAIAHIHRVPEHDVRRLGWPHWLQMATGDAALLDHPWTYDGTVDALRAGNELTERQDRTYLVANGSFARTLAAHWHEALRDPGPGRVLVGEEDHAATVGGHTAMAEGHTTMDTARWFRLRVKAAETMSWTVSPTALYPTVRGDLRLLTTLLSEAGHDRAARTSLLLLAARTAGLCGTLCTRTGENATAERFHLLAARAAAAAGAPRISAIQLAGVAYSHLLQGEFESAIVLVDAVLDAFAAPGHRLAPLLHLLAGRAHALAGEAPLSALALKRAAAELAARPAAKNLQPRRLAWYPSEDWVAGHAGIAALHLGRPQQAYEHFAPLVDARGLPRLFPVAAHELPHVVDAYLALGKSESAVALTHRALTLHGSPPGELVRLYQERFTPHRADPAVRELLDRLSAHQSAHQPDQTLSGADFTARRTSEDGESSWMPIEPNFRR